MLLFYSKNRIHFLQVSVSVSEGFAHDIGNVTEISQVYFQDEELARYEFLGLLQKLVKLRGGWAGENQSSDKDKCETALKWVF